MSTGGGAPYGKAVGGRLVLKGVGPVGVGGAGIKRTRGDISGGSDLPAVGGRDTKIATKAMKATDPSPAPAPAMTAATRNSGTGKISTSAATIMGMDSRFSTELKVGDAIEVMHPTSLTSEVRVVKMVLSDTSAGINTPFSSDLVSPITFHILKLPKVILTADMAAADVAGKRQEEEKGAYGRYASEGGKAFTYRERKDGVHGSYKVVTVQLDEKTSREDMLDMRSKKKSDKFC